MATLQPFVSVLDRFQDSFGRSADQEVRFAQAISLARLQFAQENRARQELSMRTQDFNRVQPLADMKVARDMSLLNTFGPTLDGLSGATKTAQASSAYQNALIDNAALTKNIPELQRLTGSRWRVANNGTLEQSQDGVNWFTKGIDSRQVDLAGQVGTESLAAQLRILKQQGLDATSATPQVTRTFDNMRMSERSRGVSDGYPQLSAPSNTSILDNFGVDLGGSDLRATRSAPSFGVPDNSVPVGASFPNNDGQARSNTRMELVKQRAAAISAGDFQLASQINRQISQLQD